MLSSNSHIAATPNTYDGYADMTLYDTYAPPQRLQDYYYFLQAFELYGERFFPEWDLREYCQREWPDHSEERAQHAELTRQSEALNARFRELAKERDKYNLSKAAKDDLDQERLRLLRWHEALKKEIHSLIYHTQEHALAEEERSARKCAVLDAMLAGLRSGELIARLLGERVLCSYDWHPHSRYKLILPLSYLAGRKEYADQERKVGFRRRNSVLIDRTMFDRWLRRKTAHDTAALARLPESEQVEIRVEQLLLDGNSRPKRPEFIRIVRDEFGMKNATAERWWDLYAPPAAREPGRPKSTRKLG